MTALPQIKLPTLPAPASASAHLHPAPTTSVGDVADAIFSDPTFPSRVSVTSAAPKVPRGAAAFSFGRRIISMALRAAHYARDVVLHSLAVDRPLNECASNERNSQRSDSNKHFNHCKYSNRSMVGVNRF